MVTWGAWESESCEGWEGGGLGVGEPERVRDEGLKMQIEQMDV